MAKSCAIRNQEFKEQASNLGISENDLAILYYQYGESHEDTVPSEEWLKDRILETSSYTASQAVVDNYNKIIKTEQRYFNNELAANTLAKYLKTEFGLNSIILTHEDEGETIYEVKLLQPYVSTITSAKAETKSSKKITYDDFNKEQKEAVDSAVQHIQDVIAGKKSKDRRIFVIEGKAGTGKTTIVNEIIDRAIPKSTFYHPMVAVGALAHKAVKVLNSKIGVEGVEITAKSIAGLLNMREVTDPETQQKSFKTLGGKAGQQKPPIAKASLVVIDEASMLNEEQLDMILEAIGDSNIPILLLGDRGQLPPIRNTAIARKYNVKKEDLSPAFTKTFGGKASLVTRVRQGEDSVVLSYADRFWNNSQKSDPEVLNDLHVKSEVKDSGALIVQRPNIDLVEQLLPVFKRAKETKNFNLVKIVAYRNATVNAYNTKIRKALYPNSNIAFNEGELVIFNESLVVGGKVMVENASEGIVETAGEQTEITFTTKDGVSLAPVQVVPVQIIMGFDEFNQPKYYDLAGAKALVPSEENIKAYKKNLAILAKESSNAWKKDPSTYKDYKKVEENYITQFINIGYAYAITSHKSQGSTYDVVAVDANDINSVTKISEKTKNQSIYTGLTRASNVTIVSTATTNENTIYTDIDSINNRINNVKKGIDTDKEFLPATEKTNQPLLSESSLKKREDIKEITLDDDEGDLESYLKGTQSVMEVYDDEHIFILGGNKKGNNKEEVKSNEEEEEEAPTKEEKLSPQAKAEKALRLRQIAVGNSVEFDEATHTYKIEGKKARFSVTQFKDFVLGLEHSENSYSLVSSVLGTTHDAFLRDYFDQKKRLQQEYPNLNAEQREALKAEARTLKEFFQKKWGDNLVFITDESLLRVAGEVEYDGVKYSIAGTMDMLVIDEQGNIHIVDFKTKRANKDSELSASKKDEYRFQTFLYKKLLEGEGVHATDASIAQFNIKYADPNNVKYSKNGDRIQVKIGNTTQNIEDVASKTVAGETVYESGTYYKWIKFGNSLQSGKFLNSEENPLDLENDLTVYPYKTSIEQRNAAAKVLRNTATTRTKEATNTNEVIDVIAKNTKYKLLSNMGAKAFTDKIGKREHKFATVEQYFQYKKLMSLALSDLNKDNPERQEKLKKLAYAILKDNNPFNNRKVGRHYIELTEAELKEWATKSRNVMKHAMKAAFEQNEEAKQLLLSTGTALLTHSIDDKSPFPGILMELRAEFGGSPAPKSSTSTFSSTSESNNSEAFVHNGITITTTQDTKHPLIARTIENIEWSDVTVAIAEDFDSAGERTTKKYGGDKYVSSTLYDNAELTAKTIYTKLKRKGKTSNIKLNIAGNGIANLTKGQAYYDAYITQVIQLLQEKGVTIAEIRTGGQTGIDEAGTKAALALGIKASIHTAPKFTLVYELDEKGKSKYRTSKEDFLARFGKVEPIQEEAQKVWKDSNGNEHTISTKGYRKGDPQEHPDIAYVFTENKQAADAVERGAEDSRNLKLNVRDASGKNQAGIRTDKDGNITKNAFGIITKKRQQDDEGNWLQKEGQFEDTEEDFEIFKAANNKFFKNLKNSGLKKIVWPSQMALGKSALPERFVDWLQQQLEEQFSVKSTKKKTETEGYEGYGLALETQGDAVKKEDKKEEERKKAEEKPKKSVAEILADIRKRKNNTLEEAKKDDDDIVTEFEDDYINLQSIEKPEGFTGAYVLSRKEAAKEMVDGEGKTIIATTDITDGSYDSQIGKLLDTLPYSAVIKLNTKEAGINFLYLINKMLKADELFAYYNGEELQFAKDTPEYQAALSYSKRNKNFKFDKETGILKVPSFTTGYTLQEINKRNKRNQLLNNSIITQKEVRDLAKASIYKMSEFITMLQKYHNAKEILFGKEAFKDVDFTKMERIDIIKEVGIANLLNIVKERVFNSQNESFSDKDFDTADKADLIYNNWDAFIEFAYDTLIEVEEVAMDNNHLVRTDIKNELNENQNESNDNDKDVVQELFGSELETWQVGFRQVSAFNSLSKLVKVALENLYQVDKNGEIVVNEFGIGEHLNAQEAVAKILNFVRGAQTLDAKDGAGNYLSTSMLYMLKNKAEDNPWLNQVIELLEGKFNEEGQLITPADEQFKSQFFSNFKKYFQKYAIVIKKGGSKQIKIINENEAAETAILNSKAKENTAAVGNFHLKNKDGSINKETLAKLVELHKKFSEFANKLNSTKGKIAEVFEKSNLDIDEYYNTVKEILNLLDIDVPSNAQVRDIFSVKKNSTDFRDRLTYLLRDVEKVIESGKQVTDMREYERLVQLATKENNSGIESVSYESGKMYYSYVMPSFLNKLVDKLSQSNMSDEDYQNFIQSEYLDYSWYTVGDKIRGRWLRKLKGSKTLRRELQLVSALHYLGTEYTKKTPAQYIESMMKMYFYDKNKVWSFFRIPIQSDKPSEDYIKFERLTVGYEDTILDGMYDVFIQELFRIKAVNQRKITATADQKIKFFDEKGSEFVLEDYLQQYLDGSYVKSSFYRNLEDEELKEKLDRFSELLQNAVYNDTALDDAALVDLFKQVTKLHWDLNFKRAKKQWIREGFLTKNKEGKYTNSLNLTEQELREFYWNDAFAATNILELTVTDTAFYPNAEELQKRLAQLHAPGNQANINARDKNGILYTKDGKFRALYIRDNKIKSNALANLKKSVEHIIADTPKERKATVKMQLEAVIGAFEKINFADAQGYTSPTAYRKKMGTFGMWSDKMEDAYDRLRHPEKYSDTNFSQILDTLWQPLKPFVYGSTKKDGHNDFLPTLKVNQQIKESEYVLIIADAIMRRTDSPNKLKAIFDFMEESQLDSEGNPNGEGIDTIVFESGVKTGNTGIIDLNFVNSEDAVKSELQKAFVGGTYNLDYVHEFAFENFIIQQNVPAHFKSHSQNHGSQDRVLTFTDMPEVDPKTGDTLTLKIDGKEISVKEAKQNYFDAIAENIHLSAEQVYKKFNLDKGSKRQKNIALSRLLKDEILKDSRYGADMYWAVDTNEFGEFNVPLSDPIHSNRIQQLLNSIIKNTINKQTIAGGPVVQVSSWGTSDDLSIVYKDSDDKLLLTEKQFNQYREEPENANYDWETYREPEVGESYDEYIEDQSGVAYFEVYATISDDSIYKDFARVDSEGNTYIDVEEIEANNPKLLEMIGYRIPTENKHSMAPLKIKGFLPSLGGEGIMLPADITTISGSDKISMFEPL